MCTRRRCGICVLRCIYIYTKCNVSFPDRGNKSVNTLLGAIVGPIFGPHARKNSFAGLSGGAALWTLEKGRPGPETSPLQMISLSGHPELDKPWAI